MVVGTGSLTDHTFATADHGEEPIQAVDDASSPTCDHMPSGFWHRIHAVRPDWLQAPCRAPDAAVQDLGWVRSSRVLVPPLLGMAQSGQRGRSV